MPASIRRTAIVCLALAAACSSHTASVPGITWVAPVTNADGSPLTDLAGYRLHYDTTGRGNDAHHLYAHVVDLPTASCAGTECQADLPDLGGPPGTRYFLS